MDPVDGQVRPVRGTPLARDSEHVVVHRKLDLLSWRDENRAVRAHELDVRTRLAELGAYSEIALATLPGQDPELLNLDLRGPRLERLVDGCAELLAGDEVEQNGGGDDRQRDGGGRRHGDARPEAHPSRSA